MPSSSAGYPPGSRMADRNRQSKVKNGVNDPWIACLVTDKGIEGYKHEGIHLRGSIVFVDGSRCDLSGIHSYLHGSHHSGTIALRSQR